ncbi:MAG: hypothetical protein IPQ10_07295 [Saprospiraceae bacterium]|jgi:hypothetical protein|nr:hypothetical protein [Saprospiraceae bacterium]MBK9379462.1 hypothetical protein [Saprospiraceae bacterium]MBL0260859.1 hypothetical protein [Saprospiraceae bacterium]MBX7163559.1 hypothetical protein [Saprospiraceae bacterium]
MNLLDEISGFFQNSMQSFVLFLPTIINALLVLIIGWVIAKIVQWIVLRISDAVGIDTLASKSGVQKFLEKRGYKKGISGVAASICFWAIILIVLVNFFNLLGMEVVSDLLNQLILFIPNILIACVLIILGFYLAEFVSSLVAGSLEESGFENPELVGKMVFYAIGIFTLAIALTQIGIGEMLITNVVSIMFASVGLALAIAFGFGAREWARNVIRRYLYNPDKDRNQNKSEE